MYAENYTENFGTPNERKVYFIKLDKIEGQPKLIRILTNALIEKGYTIVSVTKNPYIPIKNPEQYEITKENTLTKVTILFKNNVTSRSISVEYDDPPVLTKPFYFEKKKSALSKVFGKKEYVPGNITSQDYTSSINITSANTPARLSDLDDIDLPFLSSLINQYKGIKPIQNPIQDPIQNPIPDPIKYPITSSFKDEQINFINSLTTDEQKLLTTYTYQGDRVINNILRYKVAETQPTQVIPHITNLDYSIKQASRRGGDVETIVPTPSQIKQRAPADIVGTLPLYINKFLNVFKKVPVLKKPLTVYRGVKGAEGLNIHDNQFISTSYVPGPGRRFAGKECCFLTITLQPGVRALFIEPISRYDQELEILVGPPFKATVTKGANNKEYNVTISPISKGGLTYKRKYKRRITRRKQMKFKQ